MKTVNIQVRWAAAQPGQDRRLPSVATHSRLQRATSVRSRVGIILKDGSGVAIDWVTGRSYSSARRRLNVQSGQRKGGKCAAAPTRALPSVIVDTEKVLREADGSVKLVVVRPHTDGKVFAPGCASKPDGESREEPEEHKRGSISSTPRIRNSKKPSRTHVRSWKHQWLLLCPVKL